MNEPARTGLAESEQEVPSEENSIGAATRTASSKNADLEEWPKDEPCAHEDQRSLWPRDSSLDPVPLSAKPVRIAIKTKGRILLINPADILAVEAEGNYVLMRHRNDSYSLREPISNLAEKLKDYGFVRVHRSVLVNSSCVEEIHPGPTGEHTLRIIGGKEYTVSRTYKHNLKWLAQSWIGTDSFVDE